MKDWKINYRIVDIQDGAVHKIGEHNFPQHELATRNQNNCSSLGCRNQNLIHTLDWKDWCSSAHLKNWKLVPMMDNCYNYDMDLSSMNMVHASENFEGSWQDLASYHYEKHKNYQPRNSCFTLNIQHAPHKTTTNFYFLFLEGKQIKQIKMTKIKNKNSEQKLTKRTKHKFGKISGASSFWCSLQRCAQAQVMCD